MIRIEGDEDEKRLQEILDKNKAERQKEVEGNNLTRLNLVLSETARRRIQCWVDLAPGEVSGLGKVQCFKATNTLFVDSVYLLKQKNTGSSTELDAAEVGRLMYLTRKEPGELKFWWHSHANMSVFWSETDTDTFRQLGSNGWICGTVFNKARQMLSALYLGEPMGIWCPDIPTSIYSPILPEWKSEYDEATKDDRPSIAEKLNIVRPTIESRGETPPPIPRSERRKRKKARREYDEQKQLDNSRLPGWSDYDD